MQTTCSASWVNSNFKCTDTLIKGDNAPARDHPLEYTLSMPLCLTNHSILPIIFITQPKSLTTTLATMPVWAYMADMAKTWLIRQLIIKIRANIVFLCK